MATHVLGIDEGTTCVTVAVADADGTVVSNCSSELSLRFPRPDWVEQDPEEIWSTVARCCHAAVEQAGLHFRDIAAIGIANQRETTMIWDRATGRPLARAIAWQDRRGAMLCDELSKTTDAAMLIARTGLVLDPYFTASKLAWLLASDHDMARRAWRGELCVGTVDTWLIWKLTAGAVHATDATNASRTLLMDLDTLEYDQDLLRIFSVPYDILPEIRPSGSVFGEVAPNVFGVSGIPVAAVLGDQQAALFAQGCHEPGQGKNTYGTGSFVLVNTGTKPLADRGRLLATVARGLPEGADYALEGSIFTTGAAVQWLRDGLGLIASPAETEALAASLTDNDDVWFVPALSGLGAPYWDPHARGTLLGATRATTRAHLARAVLESIAWRTRDVLEEMARVGMAVQELRADGGAAANNWLMQFQADVAGIPVEVAPSKETTSLGAMFLAGRTVGLWASDANLNLLRGAGRRFEPRWSQERRDESYRRWRSAVDRASRWASDPI